MRRLVWRSVFAATGGLTVSGRLPNGPCVVVANHSSHADAPALVAALGSRVRVAAAADYWFAKRGRARLCRLLVGGFAVRRTGGGSADLAAAGDLLRAGKTVVVFPEGTRSRDGSLAEFRSGAFRLAAAAGVPVVPVGLAGTRNLIPVGGRLQRSPIAVRIGRPLLDPEPAAAQSAVCDLAAAPATRPVSRLGAVARRLAHSRAGLALLFCWAAAEALSWPLLPEFALGLLVVMAPRRAPQLVLAALAGSLAGGLLAYHVSAPQPLTPARMHATVRTQYAAEGAAALRHQPWSGIPYKVYAHHARESGVPLAAFLGWSAIGRGSRFAVVALVLALFGVLAHATLRRWFAAYAALFATFFTAGLARVVAAWS